MQMYFYLNTSHQSPLPCALEEKLPLTIKESNNRQANSLCLWTTRMVALVSPQTEIFIWKQTYGNFGECTVIYEALSSCAPQDYSSQLYFSPCLRSTSPDMLWPFARVLLELLEDWTSPGPPHQAWTLLGLAQSETLRSSENTEAIHLETSGSSSWVARTLSGVLACIVLYSCSSPVP